MMEVNGQRKRGRPKMTWKRQVEGSVKKVGLKIEEAADRTRWREGVRAIAEGMRCIRPPSVTRKNRIKTGLMMMMMILSYITFKILGRLLSACIEPTTDPLLSREQDGFRHRRSTIDQGWYTAQLLLHLTQCVNFVCSLS